MKKLYNRNKDIELYHRQKLEKERKLATLTPKLQSRSERTTTPNLATEGQADEGAMTTTENGENENVKEELDKTQQENNEDEEESDDELEMIRQFKVREEQHIAELQQR